VVALDSHGQPVGDLTAGDFEIADAGKPQKVAIFRHSESKLTQAAPPGAGEFSNRGAANVQHATVILLDLLNQSFGRGARRRATWWRGLKSVESGDALYLYLLTADAKAIPGARHSRAGKALLPHWTAMRGPGNAKALVDGALAKGVPVASDGDRDLKIPFLSPFAFSFYLSELYP